MGRKRLPEDEKKVPANISLPRWMLLELDKLGVRSRVVEEILRKYLKKPENGEK